MSHDKEWYQLPHAAALARLIEVRDELRKKNLFDTEEPAHPRCLDPLSPEAKHYRTADGSGNDASFPLMGSTGSRLGRNIPLSEAFPDTANLYSPNPRTVSLELFTRTVFQPATRLNVLAAAWIQFQVHDWFAHKKGDPKNSHEITLRGDDPWTERPMRVPKTPVDLPRVAGSARPPAYVNESSHWWDGSQIYGSTAAAQATIRAREHGKVRVGSDGRLEVDAATGLEVTGMTENAWLGLSLLHGLFALEHNAICDRLRAHYPAWSDERLFQQARLINAALMAKIHTIEWTPAILPNPVTKTALRTNWSGLLPHLHTLFPTLEDRELLSGIPGSPTDHHAVPYSLTEEFASVYRMHSLLPDEYLFRSARNGSLLGAFELPSLAGSKGRTLLEQFDVTDLLYSFGIAHPGALRLHNFPRHLQNLRKDSGEHFDMAAVDILRDRERGVPRYNRFRRLFHKQPVGSFDELTDNPQWAAEIERVYEGDLERVDLLVGLMAEPLPTGLGFSDTAFRVFVLMASRRLKSDRFLSQDYGPEIYTQPGIDWIEHTALSDVLRRHFPGLSPALAGVENAFHPWSRQV